jgi:signal transduction histidine kinase
MKIRSLRIRLLLLAAAAVTAALIIASIGLVSLFGRFAERRIGQELDTHIAQLAGNLRFDAQGALFLDAEPGDPRFEKAFSGLYWQVADEMNGVKLRSLSLWDADLPPLPDAAAFGRTVSAVSAGPDSAKTLLHERRIILVFDNSDRPVRISAAINAAELQALKTGFGADIVPGVALLALALLAGLWWQVSQGLKPVNAIGAAIRGVSDGKSARLSSEFPAEVMPLVEEVNKLLVLQESSLLRARDRAADLAHGLKTPLTALMSDVKRLRKAGQAETADDIEALARRMRQTVDRELARSRIRNAGTRQSPVSAHDTAQAVIRTLKRTPQGEFKQFDNLCAAGATALIDADDLNELLGNLLENAVRAAKTRVRVTAESQGRALRITVADDGAAAAPQAMEKLIARGARLDQSKENAGLGLSLVADILEAYGSKPEFSVSGLGGLAVSFTLPAAGGQAKNLSP